MKEPEVTISKPLAWLLGLVLAAVISWTGLSIQGAQRAVIEQSVQIQFLTSQVSKLEGKIDTFQEELYLRTRLRYTSEDASKDFQRVNDRLVALERRLEAIEKKLNGGQ